MSGLGSFDQTGRIGSSLKSGLMNYALGQGARYLGGAGFQTGINPMSGMEGMKYGFSRPTGSGGIKNLFKNKQVSPAKIGYGEGMVDPKLAQAVKDQPTVVEKITSKISDLIPESTLGKVALGGSAIALGTQLLGQGPEETVDIIMNRGEGLDLDSIRLEVREAFKDPSGEKLLALRNKYPYLGTQASKNIAAMAQGGRIRAQEGGIMDLGGMEKDYRNTGGFVDIGAKEKADDVPARLSVNEFVMTADAVRGAGGGDIDKGAEIMERVMENLEKGGRISEESQGLKGAQEMFEVSERLSEVV
jgi:hypothetical protein